MEKLAMCRICLSEGAQMYTIASTHLKNIYEALAMTQFLTEDSRPAQVCYMCCARLKNSYQLRQSCQHSEMWFARVMKDRSLKPEVSSLAQKLGQNETILLTTGVKAGVALDKVKTEPTVFEDDAAVERAVTQPDRNATGVRSECDKPLDIAIVKQEPVDDDTVFEEYVLERDDNNQSLDLEDRSIANEKQSDVTANTRDDSSAASSDDDTATLDVIKKKLVDEIPRAPIEDKPQPTAQTSLEDITLELRKSEAKDQIKDPVVSSKLDHENVRESFGKDTNTYQSKTRGNKRKTFICDTCGKLFTRRCSFLKHIRVHTGEKPYQCFVCMKGFTQNNNLRKHLRTHTGNKPYQCEVCDRSYTLKNHLVKHFHTHANEKTFQCTQCEKCFYDSYSLKLHVRTHTGEKGFQCNICGKSFSVKCTLDVHVRIHTGEKPYQCNVCEKRFSDNSSYNRHIRIHTGEKPHQCDICKKRFIDKSARNKHFRTHVGTKPNVCNICMKDFTMKSDLKKHMRTHDHQKPFQCNVCMSYFSGKASLRVHLRRHTGEQPLV